MHAAVSLVSRQPGSLASWSPARQSIASLHILHRLTSLLDLATMWLSQYIHRQSLLVKQADWHSWRHHTYMAVMGDHAR
jgi:hypothetical protein